MSQTVAAGGIVLPDHKPAFDREISNALVPKRACVPLHQHLGEPAVPVVRVGDRVQEGTLIGKGSGVVSASVHSPIPGIVSAIETVRLANGRRSPAIVVELGGEFARHSRTFAHRAAAALTDRELHAIVEESGIVGLGGSTFPTHLKLHLPLGTRPDILIVNGVECEPYLSADYRLMLERPRAVIEGAGIAARMLRTSQTIVAIDERAQAAVQALAPEAAAASISVNRVRHLYPLGEEGLLAEALVGRRPASGESLLSVDVVVLNVATVYALYEAVVLRKPLYERVVTLAGGALREPANLKARFGTPIGSLLEECGGFITQPEKVVAGGPFTGYQVHDLGSPLTKGISAILALTREEVSFASRTACFACGRCVDACPRGLDPSYLVKRIEHGQMASATGAGLLECIECGCCSYVCPAHIPLAEVLRRGRHRARSEEVA